MLKLSNIHTYYNKSHILQGVSLEVKRGSITALIGRNGAGKTTAINSIIGFNPPRRGEVLFKEWDITGLPVHEIAQRGIGLVPQGRRIFKQLTVLENLRVASGNVGVLSKTLEEIYSYFPVLRERSRGRGGQLSGGEQQMLAIARALLTNPDLLLLDEPSEGLAPMIVENIGRIVEKLSRKDLSILLVEQKLPLVFNLAHYVYIISTGKIVYESTAQVLMNDDQVLNQHLGVQR